jgi:hypothetical protein
MCRSIPDYIFNPSLEKCQQEIRPKSEGRSPKETRKPKSETEPTAT